MLPTGPCSRRSGPAGAEHREKGPAATNLDNVQSNAAGHWDAAYAQGDATRSWYQEQADVSVDLIRSAAPPPDASIVDVGGGASTLVDGLVSAGYLDLTVTDISAAGLAIAQQRLGLDAREIEWSVDDVRDWEPVRQYDVWHDRAVLHFMVADEDRLAYRRTLRAATQPGSTVIIGVFGPEGPDQCSGLPVLRYDVEQLAAFLGPEFHVADSFVREHSTPSGANQQFLWASAIRL